jgi:hypothetical protein
METEQTTPAEPLQYELRKEAICGHPEITIPSAPWKVMQRPGYEDVVIASATNEEVCMCLIAEVSAYPHVNVEMYPYDYATERTPAERDAIARIIAVAPDMLNWLITFAHARKAMENALFDEQRAEIGKAVLELDSVLDELIARATGKGVTNG